MSSKSIPHAYDQKLTHPKYRADIDGLRAVAVLSVIGFHAFPRFIKGGFIGVDIFFVISGYLISTIIFENLERGSFSFVAFYSRRIKRIFPSLLIVLAACFAFGWFALLADEYKQLGKHIAGGAGFISNFILLHESGYFDNGAETKPLLHLWSLGIEEQFYIIWPLLLWVAFKKRFNLLTLTIVVAATSFYFNLRYISGGHVVADFYLPQTRFWELSAGSLLAWLTQHKQRSLSKFNSQLDGWLGKIIYAQSPAADGSLVRNVRSLAGALLITIGMVVITNQSNFPGWLALLPTLGAVLIISAGAEAWLNRAVLSHRILVWFGLISFPLYLWNWPLLSFARIIQGDLVAPEIRVAAISISIGLAWLTYKFIEKPVRFGNHGKTKTIILIALMILTGIIGYSTYREGGWELRSGMSTILYNYQQLQWNDYKSDRCVKRLGMDSEYCMQYGNENNIEFAILGDSTANALAPGLGAKYANENSGLIDVGAASCPPIRGMVETKNWGAKDSPLGPDCIAVIENAYAFVLNQSSIKTVFLPIFAPDVVNWGAPGVKDDDANKKFSVDMALFEKDIAALKKAGKKVVITYDGFITGIDPRACVSRPITMNRKIDCVDGDELLKEKSYIDMFDHYFKNRKDICLFRQSKLLPRGEKISLLDSEGKLLMRDGHHLSLHGSSLMASRFDKTKCRPE